MLKPFDTHVFNILQHDATMPASTNVELMLKPFDRAFNNVRKLALYLYLFLRQTSFQLASGKEVVPARERRPDCLSPVARMEVDTALTGKHPASC